MIASLDGLSRSTLGKKPEFTIHFKNEYDYRFSCDMGTREKIIKTLKCLYGLHTKKNLPIYDIHEQNLRGYTTTEKNKK